MTNRIHRPYRGMVAKPAPGALVRFTRAFLAATRQEDVSNWRIVQCDCELCKGGRHVAVNEPSIASGYQDPPVENRPRWRHISYLNLEAVKVPEGEDTALPLTPRVTK